MSKFCYDELKICIEVVQESSGQVFVYLWCLVTIGKREPFSSDRSAGEAAVRLPEMSNCCSLQRRTTVSFIYRWCGCSLIPGDGGSRGASDAVLRPVTRKYKE
uniref:Uncharacterized protein n=1 Tax=Arundo donax TaxID=35708 RepID=A0A0A9CQF1_ARUDO